MHALHLVALALAFEVLTAGAGRPVSSEQTLRLVHLSDVHASRADHNPNPRFPGDPLVNDLAHSLEILDGAVDCINTRLRPALVVITGDLVDRGDDLESLKEVKVRLDRLACPYYPVIGDHDRRATYEKVFPGKLDYAFDHRGWHFVCLDASSGRVEQETLKWLAGDLSTNKGRPSVVMLHRPLASDVLSDYLARKLYGGVKLTLENAAQTRRLLQSCPDVRLVLSGHTHLAKEQSLDGICLSTAPALVVAPHWVRVMELSEERITSELVSVFPAIPGVKQEGEVEQQEP